MSQEKLTVFSPDHVVESDGLEDRLREIEALDDVYKVVGLVDVHMKASTECPSSVVTATENYIYPKLSSVAQNCGMSLAHTGYRREQIDDADIDRFMDAVSTSDARIMARPDLTVRDMEAVVREGAGAIIEKFGMSADVRRNLEFDGCIPAAGEDGADDLHSVVPRRTLDRGRYGFGVIPSGNHFLELQVVEELLDAEECEKWRLGVGDVMVMIHSDGGVVSDDLGNLYGNRSTASGLPKLVYNLRKSLLHLGNVSQMKNFERRWAYYFRSEKYGRIDPDSVEGRRYLRAHAMSMNAGYASRLESLRRFGELMRSSWGEADGEYTVLRDLSHNSIFREVVDGKEMWVHRHNVNRVRPGDFAFLPGYDYTSSYVCIGGEGAETCLNSVDHGAGETIKRFKKAGRLTEFGPDRVTRRYDNLSSGPRIVPHVSDEGIRSVVDFLQDRRVIHPIARLRPFAGYRYMWRGRATRTIEKVKSLLPGRG